MTEQLSWESTVISMALLRINNGINDLVQPGFVHQEFPGNLSFSFTVCIANPQPSTTDARNLVRKRDCVLVAMNYRLGVFGFLALRELAATRPSFRPHRPWRLDHVLLNSSCVTQCCSTLCLITSFKCIHAARGTAQLD